MKLLVHKNWLVLFTLIVDDNFNFQVSSTEINKSTSFFFTNQSNKVRKQKSIIFFFMNLHSIKIMNIVI